VENRHLMSEGQHFKFQGGPTAKPEGGQRNHRKQDRKHAGHDKPVGAKLQCLQSVRNYEQRQDGITLHAWLSMFHKVSDRLLLRIFHQLVDGTQALRALRCSADRCRARGAGQPS
jgi:hypothetical protein